MVVTAASDLAKVVVRAIDSEEPWSPRNGGGIVGEKTSLVEIARLAERITGSALQLSSFVIDNNAYVASRQKVPHPPSPRLRPTIRPIQIPLDPYVPRDHARAGRHAAHPVPHWVRVGDPQRDARHGAGLESAVS